MFARAFLFLLLLVAAPASAQTFPELSGRVVDQANLLSAQQEAELSERLAQVETASSRQFVVATVASLEGQEIEDYGYRLGRHWGIGQAQTNNGVILLVAPAERRVRIEVGYGLEGILTDALSSQIIDEQILPRFRANDYPGGIIAGADAIIEQLQAPPEMAEQRVAEAAATPTEGPEDTGWIFPLIFWGVVVIFILAPMLNSGLRGRRYGRGGRIITWGGSGWSSGSSGSSWSSGSSGGGFSGGGGSFGGGGASGGW